MIFTRKKHIDSNINLSIDGESICEVQKTKFLGVIIDKKLTWKEHIAFIAGKISRGMGMVIKARNFLNKEGLITVYYSFIYPYLIYCNLIWGCTYKTNLQRLVILQNRIVRIISHAKSRESSLYIDNLVLSNLWIWMDIWLLALCSGMLQQEYQIVLHLYFTETMNTIIMRLERLIIFIFLL